MKLYHGSTTVVRHPNIKRGRKKTDFGKGFYTTTNFEQAAKWANLKRQRERSGKAIVSIFEVPDSILDVSIILFIKFNNLFAFLLTTIIYSFNLSRFTPSLELLSSLISCSVEEITFKGVLSS